MKKWELHDIKKDLIELDRPGKHRWELEPHMPLLESHEDAKKQRTLSSFKPHTGPLESRALIPLCGCK